MHSLRAAALAAMTLLVAACGPTQQPAPTRPADDDAIGHIHGLGIDPADDSLYVATHYGLFHVDRTGDPTRVADRWQDTMAFTVVGPGHFLGSGHPDLSEDLPSHLGLIESTDAGESWTPLAMHGEADFHILEEVRGVLYAYDATSGRLLSSRDREHFDVVATRPLISIAAHPQRDYLLVATTGRGELVTIDATTGEFAELGGPTTVLLETTPEGVIVGIDPGGVVRTSRDGARSWSEVGALGGPPSAFTISDGDWYAATEDRVLRSSDAGATWQPVL